LSLIFYFEIERPGISLGDAIYLTGEELSFIAY